MIAQILKCWTKISEQKKRNWKHWPNNKKNYVYEIKRHMWKIKRLIKEKIFEESREVKSITGNMKQPKYKI